MKKSSASSKSKKKTPPEPKGLEPLGGPLETDNPNEEQEIAGEQFSVGTIGDGAASSGHRVEPIEPDEEGNAQKLIEEGLHGYTPESLKKTRQRR
jgi:hypothetical protein